MRSAGVQSKYESPARNMQHAEGGEAVPVHKGRILDRATTAPRSRRASMAIRPKIRPVTPLRRPCASERAAAGDLGPQRTDKWNVNREHITCASQSSNPRGIVREA
jgi:hypothetical protein